MPRLGGWNWCECIPVAIDDHSRIAFSAVYANEKRTFAIAFPQAALAYYARFGIRFRALHKTLHDLHQWQGGTLPSNSTQRMGFCPLFPTTGTDHMLAWACRLPSEDPYLKGTAALSGRLIELSRKLRFANCSLCHLAPVIHLTEGWECTFEEEASKGEEVHACEIACQETAQLIGSSCTYLDRIWSLLPFIASHHQSWLGLSRVVELGCVCCPSRSTKSLALRHFGRFGITFGAGVGHPVSVSNVHDRL